MNLFLIRAAELRAEAARLEAEAARLEAEEIARLRDLVKRAGEWGNDCGAFSVRHCCGTRDYQLHRNGCEYAA